MTTTRNVLAAGVIAIALAGGGYLIGRDSVDRPPPPPPATPAKVEEPAARPVVDVILQRADLVRLAATAADASAGGPAAADDLAGRRFVLRIPFGCAGPSGDAQAPFGWTYDEETESLRVRVTPQQWVDQPWLAQRLEGRDIESIEGFWLPRPWTRVERCPEGVQPSEPGARASTLGIAQFFGADSSRVSQRRGRALQLVERIPREQLQAARGFHLLLEGRVARVPGGAASVICNSPGAYIRPTCLIAVEFGRVAIENPATQRLLAEWQI